GGRRIIKTNRGSSKWDRASASFAIRDKLDPFAAPCPNHACSIPCRACPDLHHDPANLFPVAAYPRAQTPAAHFPAGKFPNAEADREKPECLSVVVVQR